MKQRRLRNRLIIIGIFVIMVLLVLLADPNREVNSKSMYIEYCEEIGEQYNIAPELLLALMERESGFNPKAKSKAGAVGLCQIIPKYQKERMEELGVTDLYDPYSNILVCADILAEFREKYYGDLYLCLMCYNEGEYGGAKIRWDEERYSSYATGIVERAAEFGEVLYGSD